MKRILTSTVLSLGLIAFAPSSHADGYQIAKANDCFKCHDVSKEKKGPSFQYISNAYKGRNDAVGRIQRPIRHGITYYGFWKKMPANPNMSDADLQELTRWILSQ